MKTWSKDAFAGYLAAMIDGEGCIEIVSDLNVRVRIANTILHTLEAIKDRMGIGRVIEYKRPEGKNYKRLFCYEVSNSRDILELFSICGDYIHMKRDQMQQAVSISQRKMDYVKELDDRNKQILSDIQSGMVQNAIAKKYGVSAQLVSRIKLGKSWPSVISGHLARKLSRKNPAQCDQLFRQ